MVEIDVDITPETDDDDSYSSSFHETDSGAPPVREAREWTELHS